MFKMKSQATRSQRPYSLLERQGVKFQEMKLEQKMADTYLVGPSRRGAVRVRTKMIDQIVTTLPVTLINARDGTRRVLCQRDMLERILGIVRQVSRPSCK